MRANSDKSHLLLNSELDIVVNINGDIISSTKSEKFLAVTVHCRLTFDDEISRICDKTNRELSALARIFFFMKTTSKKAHIDSIVVSSQFSYCPLWLFYSIRLNKRISCMCIHYE